jgi:hypothetical protein
MKPLRLLLLTPLLLVGSSQLRAQAGEGDLRLFGYFQNHLFFQRTTFDHPSMQELNHDENSFGVQQLNVFLQRDLARRWTAFVNFELINSYSSLRRWGGFNLEEAWVKYRFDKKLTIKLGQHIPPFNHLNEIKNRTPLLPYVVRPLVYETSFSEFIATEDYAPGRAFVQAYGFLPHGETKLDYALYWGNGPDINSADIESHESHSEQTGVDTTANFLVGGRLGMRHGELKAGFSATYEQVKSLHGLEPLFSLPPDALDDVPRWRWGADLSFLWRNFSFEGEIIHVGFDDDVPLLKVDRDFYYGTLGRYFTEELFAYVSYQSTEEDFTSQDPESGDFYVATVDISLPEIGAAYRINDRVTLKAQYAPVGIDVGHSGIADYDLEDNRADYLALAVSVIF